MGTLSPETNSLKGPHHAGPLFGLPESSRSLITLYSLEAKVEPPVGNKNSFSSVNIQFWLNCLFVFENLSRTKEHRAIRQVPTMTLCQEYFQPQDGISREVQGPSARANPHNLLLWALRRVACGEPYARVNIHSGH